MHDQRSTRLTSFATIALLGLLSLLAFVRAEGPSPRRGSGFSAIDARAIVKEISGSGEAHPVGSPANQRRRDAIVTRLRSLGYSPEIQRKVICNSNGSCATVENIVASLPGSSADAILVACHYDSVPAGPGAGDDASSVAIVLELARLLRNEKPRNTVIFLIDDGEEAGLFGAEAFTRHHPLAASVRAIINLEARGTSGNSHMFETSSDHGWLIDIMRGALKRPSSTSIFYSIYQQLPNDTDLTVFKRAQLEGLNFAFIGHALRYHTTQDSFDNLSLRSLQHQGDNAFQMLQALVRHDLRQRGGGERTYFDVFNFFLVSWPAAWNVIVLALLTVMAIALVVRMRERLTLITFLRTIALELVTISIVALLGYAAGALLTSQKGAFLAEARPSIVGVWLMTAAVVFLFRSFSTREPENDLIVFSFIAILLGFAAVIYLPGAAYVGLVLAIAALMLAAFARSSTALRMTAAIVCTTMSAVVLFPLACQLVDALGSIALTATALTVALATIPSCLAVGPLVARWTAVVSGIAGALLLVISFALPAYSARDPRPFNITYFHDAEAVKNYWLASDEPQQSMISAVPKWERGGLTLFRGLRRTASHIHAPAADFALPSPKLTATSRAEGTGREVLLVIQPRSLHSRLTFVFDDAAASFLGASVGNEMLPPFSDRYKRAVAPGVIRLTVRNAGEALPLTLRFSGLKPVTGVVYETTFGVPDSTITRHRARHEAPHQDGDTTVVSKSFAF